MEVNNYFSVAQHQMTHGPVPVHSPEVRLLCFRALEKFVRFFDFFILFEQEFWKRRYLVSCTAVVCGSRIHKEILVSSSKVDILEHLFTILLFILWSYSLQPNKYFATRQTGIREECQLSHLGATPDKRRPADG